MGQNIQHTLVFDTSTERAVVALGLADQLVDFIDLPFGLNHSRALLPSINELLQRHGVTMAQIGCIGIGNGPGSYTGIRVAAAIAQGLAFCSNIPIVEIPTMELFLKENERARVLIDAKTPGVYRYAPGKDAERITIEQLEREMMSEPMDLIAPAVDVIKKRLSGFFPGVHWREAAPNPHTMLRLACGNKQK